MTAGSAAPRNESVGTLSDPSRCSAFICFYFLSGNALFSTEQRHDEIPTDCSVFFHLHSDPRV